MLGVTDVVCVDMVYAFGRQLNNGDVTESGSTEAEDTVLNWKEGKVGGTQSAGALQLAGVNIVAVVHASESRVANDSMESGDAKGVVRDLAHPNIAAMPCIGVTGREAFDAISWASWLCVWLRIAPLESGGRVVNARAALQWQIFTRLPSMPVQFLAPLHATGPQLSPLLQNR